MRGSGLELDFAVCCVCGLSRHLPGPRCLSLWLPVRSVPSGGCEGPPTCPLRLSVAEALAATPWEPFCPAHVDPLSGPSRVTRHGKEECCVWSIHVGRVTAPRLGLERLHRLRASQRGRLGSSQHCSRVPRGPCPQQ